MTVRLIALLLCLAAAAPALGGEVARIVYLGVRDDPFYAPQRVYTGLSLKDRARPADGARTALRGARALGRALGVRFELEEILLPGDADPAAAVRAAREGGAAAVLLDLPEAALARVAAAEGGAGLLFNIRSRADHWRAGGCAPALLHAIPSRAMLADALAQHLRSRGWTRILLLRGDGPEDAAQSEAAIASARKFGLDIVARRDFALTNDPRRRDKSSILLLTGGVRHDVIWLIDARGEFGRYVPYATQAPRPVVGAEGLSAHAWHWTLERYGAPQLNQRFRRKAGRAMSSLDWAAWASVRAVVEAVARARSASPDRIAATIRAPEFAFDLYKGVRGSFRDWNGQLRQPILLATHNAVIAIAPIDGFEHRADTLDTLGADRPESGCRR